MKIFELQVRQPLQLNINGEAHIIAFPVPVVAEAETDTGRGLKTAMDWFTLKTEELPIILAAGLRGGGMDPDAADKTSMHICREIGPEGIDTLVEALATSAFPEAVRRFKAAQEKAAQARAQSPNGGSVAVN